jgi:FkbM family methyltransferase
MQSFLKKIYQTIPFKKVIYTVLKIILHPKESIYRHFHFVGIFNVKVTKHKSFKIKHYGYQIENEIFWAGLLNGWEKESIKLWIKLCEKSEVVLDIGANTGIYSLIAKATNPNTKVYAFEPVKRVFNKLEENILLNKFDIVLIEKAVSNSDGLATIYDTLSEHTYSVTVNKNMLSPGIKVIETKINIITLNSFIRQNNIKKIDLIKIDVETHEPEVLEGFSDYLGQFQPSLWIEILTDEIGSKVNKIIEGLGYLFFNIDEKGTISQVKKITKSDYFNYLLCSSKIAKEIGLI